MEKFYFKYRDSEICKTKDYFIDYMKNNNLNEIEVYKAEPEKVTGIFWCQVECFCGDDSADTCGKQCLNYEPRNKVSGRCRYHSTRLYMCGDKVKLIL